MWRDALFEWHNGDFQGCTHRVRVMGHKAWHQDWGSKQLTGQQTIDWWDDLVQSIIVECVHPALTQLQCGGQNCRFSQQSLTTSMEWNRKGFQQLVTHFYSSLDQWSITQHLGTTQRIGSNQRMTLLNIVEQIQHKCPHLWRLMFDPDNSC